MSVRRAVPGVTPCVTDRGSHTMTTEMGGPANTAPPFETRRVLPHLAGAHPVSRQASSPTALTAVPFCWLTVFLPK